MGATDAFSIRHTQEQRRIPQYDYLLLKIYMNSMMILKYAFFEIYILEKTLTKPQRH